MQRRKSKSLPKYCLHKATNQGYVTLNGKRRYLGAYDNPETRQRYLNVVSEWESQGRTARTGNAPFVIINLIERYWAWAKIYYRKPDGSPTSQLARIRRVLRRLKEIHGLTPVNAFGPQQLKLLRQSFIDDGASRRTANSYTRDIKLCFKWGAAESLVAPETYGGLHVVSGLRKGRSEAKETPPVRPVADNHIEAVLDYVSPQIGALIRLQLLTGARPGELVGLRLIDIDMTADTWCASLDNHKTSHHGKSRSILFGPKAQAVIRPFLDSHPVQMPLFSPKEAESRRHASAKCHRRPSQTPNLKQTDRRVGDCYTVASYRKAIHRACYKAGIPRWNPNQLRHNAATRIRAEFGLEAAQVILGHSTADVTQVYAERNGALAETVVREIG